MSDLYTDPKPNPLDRVSPAARTKARSLSNSYLNHAASIDDYINHDNDTDENITLQLAYKPSESEYFGCGFQITN